MKTACCRTQHFHDNTDSSGRVQVLQDANEPGTALSGSKYGKPLKNEQNYFPNLLVNTEFMSNLKKIGEIKAVIAF